jgi:hypothetical protein
LLVVAGEVEPVVVAVVVLAGSVTVLVGAVTVVVGVVTVVLRVMPGMTVVVVVCPMLSDLLVTVGVLELLLSTASTTTTTISAITSAAAPAMVQPLRPVGVPEGGGGSAAPGL